MAEHLGLSFALKLDLNLELWTVIVHSRQVKSGRIISVMQLWKYSFVMFRMNTYSDRNRFTYSVDTTLQDIQEQIREGEDNFTIYSYLGNHQSNKQQPSQINNSN